MEVQKDIPAEVEARELGWVPKEEFKGDPEKFVEAEEFLRRGQEIMPILQSNNRRLMDANRKLERDLEDLKETVKLFAEHHNKVSETAYKRALAKIKESQATAIKQGDGDSWQRLEQMKEDIAKPEKIEVSGKPKSERDPVFVAWAEKNDWYEKDPQMSIFADAVADSLIKQGHKPSREMLDRVAEEVKSAFPHRFSNPNRVKTDRVEGGQYFSPSAPSNGKKSYSDLPPEAKIACDKFVKQKLFKDKQAYVNEYFDQE